MQDLSAPGPHPVQLRDTVPVCSQCRSQRRRSGARARVCGVFVTYIGYKQAPYCEVVQGGAWGRQAPHERLVPRTCNRHALQVSASLAIRAVRCTADPLHAAQYLSKHCFQHSGLQAGKTCPGTPRDSTPGPAVASSRVPACSRVHLSSVAVSTQVRSLAKAASNSSSALPPCAARPCWASLHALVHAAHPCCLMHALGAGQVSEICSTMTTLGLLVLEHLVKKQVSMPCAKIGKPSGS